MYSFSVDQVIEEDVTGFFRILLPDTVRVFYNIFSSTETDLDTAISLLSLDD